MRITNLKPLISEEAIQTRVKEMGRRDQHTL